jgi:putative photosynthetic complex assembly protein 2
MGATGVMLASIVTIVATRSDTTTFGAYAAFSAALMVWGWNEVLFLTGLVTGPFRQSCPPNARGWQHFRYASLSILHHEFLIVASGLTITALTYGAQNQVACWTFLVLWAMRLSTKLNIFLGVPNLSEEFLPEHLVYLASFFRRRAMNLLFPVSVTASTAVLVVLIVSTWNPAATDFERAGLALVATLVGLGLLEHWFLVLPIRIADLWAWGFTSRQADPAAKAGAANPASGRRDSSIPPPSATGTISPAVTP